MEQIDKNGIESNIGIEPSYINNIACGHWAYQIIYQKNMEGLYEEKKICLECKGEVRGY